jgi:hypothetical protein
LVLKNWPGVEYPYNAMTAIQGYADMEYPMMINDTSIPDDLQDARLQQIMKLHIPISLFIWESMKRDMPLWMKVGQPLWNI